MKIKSRSLVKYFLLIFFLLVVFIVPTILFVVGTKPYGIDLKSIMLGKSNFNSFKELLFSSDERGISFRLGLQNSFFYSFITALVVTVFSLFYGIWISILNRIKAIELSFLLLSFTLLPQTYFILPILYLIQFLKNKPPEQILIPFVLIIISLPFGSWMFYLITTNKMNSLMKQFALDRIVAFNQIRFLLREIRTEIFIIFIMTFSLSWGNFLVPFSLGSKESFTALIQIGSFSNHMGKDWSMISASSFIICLPGLLTGLFWIFYLLNKKFIKRQNLLER